LRYPDNRGWISGATLGFQLRKSGKDVLMLELPDVKEKDKLCAE
jgi:hypothetical protein